MHKFLVRMLPTSFLVAALFATGFTAPHVAHAASGPTYEIECGAQRHNPSNFTVHSGGGYTGKDQNGHICDGSFSYVLTPTSAYAVWPLVYPEINITGAMDYIDVWAYIPNIDAGAFVNYSVTEADTNNTMHTWYFNTNFNQNAATGWTDLGTISLANDWTLYSITMNSSSQLHWDMAEDAIGLSCDASTC